MQLSIVEGMLYAAMVGLGEFWFIADAVRLGSSALELAIVVTLPQMVGALGALGMLELMRRSPSRRPLVMVAVVGQGLALLGLAVASALGATSPLLLVVAACLHHGFGQSAGTPWSSWFGEVVPPRMRGRWFGARNRWVNVVTFCGVVIGGWVLSRLEPASAGQAGADGGSGFALLYAAAGVLRLGCVGLLNRAWEPKFVPPERTEGVLCVVRGTRGSARGVVASGALMLFAVCVSAPYFAPHMLETLAFSYPTYLAAQGAMIATKVASLGMWGRWVDRYGPLRVYRIAAIGVALVPLPWVFADQTWIVFLAQALSGVAWAGHEVSLLAATLSAVEPRRRALLLTAQSLSNGIAQVGGGLCGSGLVGGLALPYTVAFAASSALRLAVALASPAWMVAIAGVRVHRSDIAARVVGWAPNGGMLRQLVFGGPRIAPPKHT